MSKEEIKEYQNKRSKPINYDKQYDREKNWNDDKKVFEREIERIEGGMKDNYAKSMNFDK